MFIRFTPFALACVLAATLIPASAQQQTAAGAQQFLLLMAQDGLLFVKTLDKASGAMTVKGTKTNSYRWLNDGVPAADGPYADASEPISAELKLLLRITRMETLDPQGHADDCTTRLETTTKEKLGQTSTSEGFIKKETFFGFDKLPYQQTTTLQYEDPVAKYAGPHYLGWGRAVITRTSTGRIVARVPGAGFDVQLVYAGELRKDADMTDRVEYAMKFLKASCDKSAATGF